MVPSDLVGYFTAAATAAAGLLGLLFVAVSLRPESIFGSQAEDRSRRTANSAFTALVNAFFLSLWALLPSINLGWVALVLGVTCAAATVKLRLHTLGGRPALGLMAVSVALYCAQAVMGALVIAHPHASRDIRVLAYLTLVSFSVALFRAWTLLATPAPAA